MVDHDTLIRGPVILRRTDSEFLPSILTSLKTPAGRTQLATTVASTRDTSGVLKLFQPVHQTFHVALVDLYCDTFGNPRLDPTKIDSSGLVIRRVSDTPGVMQRWSKAGDQMAGWVSCADDDFDPDPGHRRARVTSGNAEIDRQLTIPGSAYDAFTETVAPLFAAPPEVCAAAKATVLYGLVPVTSREKSEAVVSPTFEAATVREFLPYFLTNYGSRTVPRANTVVTAASFAGDNSGTSLLNNLRALTAEFDLFGESAEGKAFFQAVNLLSITDSAGNRTAGLGDFLKSARDALLLRKGGSITMPAAWPEVGRPDAATLAALAQKAMEARLASVMGGEMRFEDPARLYRLRAFVRVKRSDGCPPQLIWSSFSEPFSIAQWYDTAGVPPVRITLPAFDSLKALKPNVAFAMPEDLFNAMNMDAKAALAGSPSPGGSSIGLGWLCSFNIPTITICAFIVLNIFLGLFDIFLSWMLFIKICIPIPVPKKNG